MAQPTVTQAERDAGQVSGPLPCPNPWCEASDRDGDYSPQVQYSNFAMCYVACTSCSMAGPTRQHEVDAITAWNTRAQPDAVAQLVEAAKALRAAVCYADPPKLFNDVLCHEARIPVEFVAALDAALANLAGEG